MKTFKQFIEARIHNPEVEPHVHSHDMFYEIMRGFDDVSCVMLALKAAQLVGNLVPDQTLIESGINLIEKWLNEQDSKLEPQLRTISGSIFEQGFNYYDWNKIASHAVYAVGYACYAAACACENEHAEVVTNAANSAWNATQSNSKLTTELVNYGRYLMSKQPEHNNFNVPNAHLETLKKLIEIPATKITKDELTGIRTLLDEFDIDYDEFNWDEEDLHSVYKSLPEKYKLLMTIKREFNKVKTANTEHAE